MARLREGETPPKSITIVNCVCDDARVRIQKGGKDFPLRTLADNGPGDGYADSPADDLSDCFDFNQTPLQFQTIAAPLKAEYFQNDKTPVKDPDDD